MHWTRTLLLILTLNLLLFPIALFAQEKTLHIAFVSPTEEEPAGLKALKLYLDDIDWRTHNGFKIELDYYVDNNNKTQAEAVAKQIVKDNRAILVIGHNYSSTSSVAGPIYAQNAIPAISYSATNPKVTQNNPWYFRTIFNDASQGSFLAYYALKNLNYDHITIIYEPDNYGAFLAQVFEENAYLNGAKRVQSFKLNMNAPDEFKYRELHAAITSDKEQAGLIFMATHSSEGIKLVKLLRDAGVKNPIMGPDAFYSTAFIHGFDDEAKELNNPGYYTNGIFLSAPIVFDVANAEAQQLKRQYLEAYGELPDWASAYGYDTAKVLAAVIASSQGRFNHTASSLADRREAVQRALAELNSPQNAVQGVTGLNYFDQNGDAVKPIFIAVLHDKRVVSGLSQYKDVPNVDEVTNLEQQLASGSIIELADRYMYKMSVVFTGVKLHHIRRIDTQQHTSELDFTLWFRYRGDFDPSALEFSNSIDDISLPAPYMESESGNIRYKAFRIKGLFRNDFMDDIQRRGQISIGFALRNTEMDRNTLLYARDTKGIGLTGNTQLIDLVKHQILSEEIAGWRVENASIFERSVNVDSLGLPQYINIRDANVPYSQFHYIVELKQTGL